MTTKVKLKPELMAPAGNIEKLNIALHYGADAVYCGLSQFSLRAKHGTISQEDLKIARQICTEQGKKLYITCNIVAHNRNLEAIREHVELVNELQPDSVIVSDLGVFNIFQKGAPQIPLHISTQANITNYETARFWENLGASRIVLARELSLDEISEIRQKTSVELECFVHGSLCISYSGRCYISNYMAKRPANSGECSNSCRWNYSLVEETRPGQYFPIEEDQHGTYMLSSRDLRLLEHLDLLAKAGVDSFKLEGRMKGINYLSGVVKTYREAIDLLGADNFSVKPEWENELNSISHRGYTSGMLFNQSDESDTNIGDQRIDRAKNELVGVVKEVRSNEVVVELRTKIEPGGSISFLTPGIEEKIYHLSEIRNEEGAALDVGKNGEIVVIAAPPEVRANDVIRRERAYQLNRHR